MKLIHKTGFATGWYLLFGDYSADDFVYNDRGNGPELIAPSDVFGPYPDEQNTIECNLSNILVDKFSGWDNVSQKLLDDGGIVEDHLADELPRDVIKSISVEKWESAWNDYYSVVTR